MIEDIVDAIHNQIAHLIRDAEKRSLYACRQLGASAQAATQTRLDALHDAFAAACGTFTGSNEFSKRLNEALERIK